MQLTQPPLLLHSCLGQKSIGGQAIAQSPGGKFLSHLLLAKTMKLDASDSLLALPKLRSEPFMLKEEGRPVSAPYNLVPHRHLGWGEWVPKAV